MPNALVFELSLWKSRCCLAHTVGLSRRRKESQASQRGSRFTEIYPTTARPGIKALNLTTTQMNSQLGLCVSKVPSIQYLC